MPQLYLTNNIYKTIITLILFNFIFHNIPIEIPSYPIEYLHLFLIHF